MATNLSFRKCDLSDLDELREIAYTTFNDTFAQHNKPHNIESYLAKAFNIDQVRTELANPDSEFYFTHQEEELVGYIKVNFAPAQTDVNDPSSIELERIYVLSRFQSKGYGKEMMAMVLELARSRGMDYLWLGVWDQNVGAIRFYERNGFVKFDEHAFYLGDDLQTDYLMRLDL